jgi:geranylgeranyl pyrophosphate synthase
LEDFSNILLVMGSGQHQDLREQNPGLESWMKMAGAKSGGFFALACRSGARLATEDSSKIQAYSDFGYHLGILLQLLDDVGDFKAYQSGERPVLPEALCRSFVVAYAFEVTPDKDKASLRQALAGLADDPHATREVITLLDGCGAGLYLATEIERQRQSGLRALARAAPRKAAGEKLRALITQLTEE